MCQGYSSRKKALHVGTCAVDALARADATPLSKAQNVQAAQTSSIKQTQDANFPTMTKTDNTTAH